MDRVLEQELLKIESNPEVEGVVCSDLKGLCIGQQGRNVNERLAGQIASLHNDAICQWQQSPVIMIEMSPPGAPVGGVTQPGKVLLTNLAGQVCTAIVKKA